MLNTNFEKKYLKSRGHAFSPVSRRVLQISFYVLIEAIGLKTETDLLMAEPATIQQIRHRPWLKQPRLEYQADFSFGKVIFGPSFLIGNMGGPQIPTCCISTCGASETAFQEPKFQLSVFGLSADLFQLAFFKGFLALQSAQLADSESAFLS